MIHRINRRKFDIYALDIESHNDAESVKLMKTSMWLGCLINEDSKIDDENSYFYNMDELFDRLKQLSSRKRKYKGKRPITNICIYIYNLSFEWSFIIPYVIKYGLKFKERITKDDEYCFSSISTKSASSVWQCSMKFDKNDGLIIIRDLAKIYSGGLDNVAKSFKLPTQKGEINYTLNRLHLKDENGNEIPWIPTKEEKEYCFKDTRIIVDILLKQIEKGDSKYFFNAMSMASYSMLMMMKSAFPRSTKPYQQFRKIYPVLDDKEEEFVRHSYAGGITYATKEYQFKVIKQKILHIDAHQMHPTQMYKRFFPKGVGEYFTGKPTKQFKRINCCHIKIGFSKVKIYCDIELIGIPFIDNYEMWTWDFMIPLMYKCYENLTIDYIDGYSYEAMYLPFRNYIKSNYQNRLIAKQNKDTYNILYYKLLNNSAYGKFGEKAHNQIYENYVNKLGIIDSIVHEKDEIKTSAKYTYIPIASCITAYSRKELCEKALLFENPKTYDVKKLLYFDTDSIFVLLDDETQKIFDEQFDHSDFLGGWAVEDIPSRAQFTAPKRYKMEIDGETIIKSGGINFDAYKQDNYSEMYQALVDSGMSSREALREINIPYDEINIISDKYKVQRAFRCEGGTLILFQEKEISVQKKYKDIYDNNTQ